MKDDKVGLVSGGGMEQQQKGQCNAMKDDELSLVSGGRSFNPITPAREIPRTRNTRT
ncbi:MAG: hypothetical protein LBR79_03175 [Oscillospiraceae bacterium]|jgi:hypothetical protein|nr:hypothetical protein [Oscillospiraceae bacterium]